jgi:hypothetical protein
MRSLLYIAGLVVGALLAGLILSSFSGHADRPQPIRNPYVQP